MNRKGEVMTLALIAIGTYVFGTILLASVNVDVHKNEGESLKAKIGWTELSKKNGKTIWCKMKGNTNCDNTEE